MSLHVTHFHRKPHPGYFSVENLFQSIRAHLPEDIAVRVVESRFPSTGFLPRLRSILECRRQQGQINHVTGDTTFFALGLKKEITLITILDCGNLDRLSGLRRWVLKQFWFTLPIRKAAYVTTISAATKTELLQRVSCQPDKIIPIHVPIDDRFVQTPKAFSNVRPVFLHVGTKANKNLERHVEALRGLSCHLRVIGRLSYEQRDLLTASGLDWSNVFDLPLEGIVAEYVKADVLLFCSTYEGFGLPIAEANAVGRPVITSNLLSMPEVAGDAALRVDPYKVEDIRAAILRLLNEPELREELIQKGLKNAERFRAKVIAEQYAQLYRKVWEESNR